MANEEIVKKMIQEVWNNHNVDSAQNFFDQNLKVHGPHGEISGLNNFQNFVKECFKAFPDLNFAIQDLFSVDNKVVVRWVGKGTHKGNFSGNAPTNKKMTYDGISIYVVQNNKIKEYWVSADLLGLLKQLGVLHAERH